MIEITENTTIENDINHIIKKYHKPLPDFIEKLNEVGSEFFFGYINDASNNELNNLKNYFYNFSARMLDHIEEEENKEFPMMIEAVNNPEKKINSNIIKKIVEDHSNFEQEFEKLHDDLKNISVPENHSIYEKYQSLLELFNEFKRDSFAHIQAEIKLLEKFFKICNFGETC